MSRDTHTVLLLREAKAIDEGDVRCWYRGSPKGCTHIAIPRALLEDKAFADAILERTDPETWRYACEYEKTEWRNAMIADLKVIAAELWARVGTGEGA